MNFLHSRHCPCMLSGQSTTYREAIYRETTLENGDSTMKNKQFGGTLWLILIWVILTGCNGGGSSSGPAPQTNPVPSVTGVSPNSVAAGAPDTTVTISGSNFLTSSIANLNGQALKTTFASSTQLTAVLPAANLASGAADNLTVTNPGPGGGT